MKKKYIYGFISKFFAIYLMCFTTSNSDAQITNIGMPPVRNFTKKNYRAGTQNWCIDQDKRGVLYVGNNNGLLEFDGNHWRLYPIANSTIIRSFLIAKNEKIYIGGQGEIGYFESNEAGSLVYTSLNPKIPQEYLDFEDVWDIVETSHGIYFIASNILFRFIDNKMEIIPQDKKLVFMQAIEDQIFLQNEAFELSKFDGKFKKLKQFSSEISAIVPIHKDTSLIVTLSSGLFSLQEDAVQVWKTNATSILQDNTLFCAASMPNGHLALGTTSNGLLVLDQHRRIHHNFNKDNNLQNNTILSLHTDQSGNLWLALDNGIDFVQTNSAISQFYPDGKIEGTCYAAVVFNDQLYCGTNTGIYTAPWKQYYSLEEQGQFRRVPNSGGQIWSLGIHSNQLLAGSQQGALLVKDNKAAPIGDLSGIWRFLDLDNNHLLAGHYGGLGIYEQYENGFEQSQILTGLSESCRLLAKDKEENIWIAHPYRGIYRIEESALDQEIEFTFYDSEAGLPSNLNNYLFQIDEEVVFTGEQGVYYFDSAKNQFFPDDNFNDIFGPESQIKYLQQDQHGNLWYAVDDQVGILWINDDPIQKSITRMDFPELSNRLVKGFEFILPIDHNNVLIATESGFIHLDPMLYDTSSGKQQLVLTEVWLTGRKDSLLFGGHLNNVSKNNIPELHYQENALQFIYSSTNHEQYEFVEYAHYLEGSEEGWSQWSQNTTTDINNLLPGKYTFHLKAKNKFGKESDPILYRFVITPPWYASKLAYGFYGLMLAGAFIGLVMVQNKKHEREKADLESTYIEEQMKKEALVQASKQKINLLERQKLETEVQFKNQELAAAMMNLLQKNEMLTSIQASLEKLKKKELAKEDLYQEINRLLKLVKKENDMSQDWERFSRHFDQVHSNFLKRLGEQFPNLSPNDYKLSAYLKMNLSTKEIASLMSISIRGVEASRYRLRKRLHLEKSVNLTEFLMKL